MVLSIELPADGANGWRFCMGCYGLAWGAAVLWPELTADDPALVQILGAAGFGPDAKLLGAIVLLHGIAAVATLFGFRGQTYWCPAVCALGALLWTTIGLAQCTPQIGVHGIMVPALGLFSLVGGIGYSVSTIQRARSAGDGIR
jgi:hypothetical protein